MQAVSRKTVGVRLARVREAVKALIDARAPAEGAP